ncbi:MULTISPECIES: phosphoribosyltransferase [unclassified Amycolatopsis]|uniref:phosphoribosyltransferase n=1 Tax=unclassified Amycolatopsis TaxID=2618356 RepID=UPI002107FDB7|nr:phosphoribosyltransferase [Amycolatopsis sp. DSM 110486]
MIAPKQDAGWLSVWNCGENVVVLGLPRGGVPVALEVAPTLGAPLDVIVVRKLGVPYQPELALGAIGEGGVRVLNENVVRMTRVTADEIAAVQRAQRIELRRRVAKCRGGRAGISAAGPTALIVDDGVATGSTARSACRVARARGATRVVLAVPVGAPDAILALRDDADEVVCLETPPCFCAVGEWFTDFGQTTDDEVAELLRRAAEGVFEPEATTRAGDPSLRDEEVEVFAGPVPLAGHLTIPENPAGVVLFAHGSGSSRHSPHNRFVAQDLNGAALGTLLFDLLTHREEHDRGQPVRRRSRHQSRRRPGHRRQGLRWPERAVLSRATRPRLRGDAR